MDSSQIFEQLENKNYFLVSELRIRFTEDLVDKMQRDERKSKKFLNSLRYGFIGVSSGGRNGITEITKRDRGIYRHSQRFKGSAQYEALLKDEELNDPLPVKVVAHVPSGDRMVGLYDKSGSKVVFYDVYRY